MWKYLQTIITSKPLELGTWNIDTMFTIHNMSCVTCHMSHVICKKKMLELVSQESVVNGAYPVQFFLTHSLEDLSKEATSCCNFKCSRVQWTLFLCEMQPFSGYIRIVRFRKSYGKCTWYLEENRLEAKGEDIFVVSF